MPNACELLLQVVEYWNELLDPVHFSDGLHFSTEGAEVVFKHVQRRIQDFVPTKEILPNWRDINEADLN